MLPSFVIISLIAYLLEEFASYNVVKWAFFGIRAGVLSLVTKSLWTMYKKAPKGVLALIISIVSLCLVAFLKVNALIVIALGAIVGLVSSEIKRRRAK